MIESISYIQVLIKKKAFEALKKAGIKFKYNYIESDDGSTYDTEKSKVIFRLTCLDKTPEFKKIINPLIPNITLEVVNEAYGGKFNKYDPHKLKKDFTDKELYLECTLEKYLPPIEEVDY